MEGAPHGAESSEEDDESSSSSYINANSMATNADLQSFRESWQRELKNPRNVQTKKAQNKQNKEPSQESRETVAKNLFLKGMEMENAGKLYEAIDFYRRAVQIIPDIEFRLDETQFKPNKPIINENIDEHREIFDENSTDGDESNSEDDEKVDLSKDGALLNRIQKKLSKYEVFILQNREQNSLHISALPMELILYILRWVVSCDLDLRSLEMCAGVCRGFYLCARDYEIWRLACVRTWGVNCGLTFSPYLSWRDMYVNRKRLFFNGCYISKTTYIRHGENSFQDQSYRPWHLVAYYRYIRFFPEGVVLWLTTADEPAQIVGQLKHRHAKIASILTGHYRLKNDKVSVIVHRPGNAPKQSFIRRQRDADDMYETVDRTFQLEFQIKDYRKRKHVQLTWSAYSMITKNATGKESFTTFNYENKFPPLWFSRVKSYTAESTYPLT